MSVFFSEVETRFKEVHQDPDVSDSDFIDLIRDYLSDGWSLVEYKWEDGIKIWCFER